MNAVGIDVSKGKSMVTILRPFGEIVSSPFEIKHTSSDILSLIKLIHSIEGESRIVMEPSGKWRLCGSGNALDCYPSAGTGQQLPPSGGL